MTTADPGFHEVRDPGWPSGPTANKIDENEQDRLKEIGRRAVPRYTPEELAGMQNVNVATGVTAIYSEVEHLIFDECEQLAKLLIDKNRRYGNSALNPLRIFSKASPVEQINVRLDDKISRLARGNHETADTEDVEQDLMGYIILKRICKKMNPSSSVN